MIRRTLVLAVLGGVLSACGFQPLYKAPSGAKQAVSVQRMAAIDIPQIPDRDRALMDLHASLLEQGNHALAGDAVQEGAVGDRGMDGAILGHEQVGGGELGHVADRVQNHAISEARVVGFLQSPPGIGVERCSLGIGRGLIRRRTALGGDIGREAASIWQG